MCSRPTWNSETNVNRRFEEVFGIEIDRESLYEGEHLDALLTFVQHVGITQVIGPFKPSL